MRVSRRGFLGLVGSFIGGLILAGKGVFHAGSQPVFVGWGSTLAGELDTGLVGRVVDVLTNQPIPSAHVSGVESASGRVAAESITSPDGDFRLDVPEGNFEVMVSAGGYVSMSRVRQRAEATKWMRVDFQMIPLDVSPEDEQRIYDAVVTVPESPLEDLAPSIDGPSPAGSPLAVTVPETIIVDFPSGSVTMALDDYLKGVVPAEMPSGWNLEALKAQAVAARSYAVAYASRNNGHICADTRCLVYSDVRYATTNQAVDATHNEVAVYGGTTIISAFFFAKCNAVSTRNSENALASSDGWKTCRNAPWNYVAYCRARSCGGHPAGTSDCGYTGHGVGMCQWGAKAKADSGWNYRQIITHYYTSVTVENGIATPTQLTPGDGALFKSGDPITLTWSATAPDAQYYAELWYSPTGTLLNTSGWTAATSWTLGGLSKGTYQWRVKARTGSNESSFSGYRRLVTADVIYKTYFPRADRYSQLAP